LIDQGYVDFGPIGSLSHLERVFIWGPRVMDLGFLRTLQNLRALQISGMGFTSPRPQIGDAEAICAVGNLTELTLASVQVTSLNFLSGCHKLVELNLNGLPITSVDELASIGTLKKISFVDVPVVEISPLLSLPNLEAVTFLRVPARADVISELARRGVKVSNF